MRDVLLTLETFNTFFKLDTDIFLGLKSTSEVMKRIFVKILLTNDNCYAVNDYCSNSLKIFLSRKYAIEREHKAKSLAPHPLEGYYSERRVVVLA